MKTRIYAAPAVKGLTLRTFKYIYTKHRDQRVSQFVIIIMSQLAISAEFKYLCYGSTVIIYIFFISAQLNSGSLCLHAYITSKHRVNCTLHLKYVLCNTKWSSGLILFFLCYIIQIHFHPLEVMSSFHFK